MRDVESKLRILAWEIAALEKYLADLPEDDKKHSELRKRHNRLLDKIQNFKFI